VQEPKDNAIDEVYFDTICRKLPFLRKLREDQKTTGNNYFALLIHFFKKFSDLEANLDLKKNPQQRYELLFNIIEMGNLISTMRLVEKCEELKSKARDRHERDDIQICTDILLTLKRYRNVVADGYHAYSTQISADIIPFFQHFFKELSISHSTQRFSQTREAFKESMFGTKEEFRQVNTPEEIYRFISSDGDKQTKKLNICTLLDGIKYFLDKAAALYRENKKDCASLYFIAAANCARDLENYFLVKTMKLKGLETLDPNANIEHYAIDRRDQHIKHLLISLRKLRQDRGQQFAHKVGDQKSVTVMAMKRRVSDEQEAKVYMSNIYTAIDTYLQREYDIRPTMAKHTGTIKITDDSPRGYKLPTTRRISPVSSSECKEKRTRNQSSFSLVLARLSDETTLNKVQAIAKDIVHTDISLCRSTSQDDADKLMFVVDTTNPDEEIF
jgi:hypothetical protein